MKRMILLVIVFLTIVISGCADTEKTSVKAPITKQQAMEIISSDLNHHGINYNKLEIRKIEINENGTKAVIQCMITLPNGSSLQTISLYNENGEWFIEGHKH